MLIVEFLGQPGAGKTTMASGVWHLAKKAGLAGYDFEREPAQVMINYGQQALLQTSQPFVSALHLNLYRLHRDRGTKVLITDTSPILNHLYNKTRNKSEELSVKLILAAFEAEPGIEYLRFRVKRPEDKPYTSYGRMQNEHEAAALSVQLDDLIARQYDSVNFLGATITPEALLKIIQERQAQHEKSD